jgi:hypothetical protein
MYLASNMNGLPSEKLGSHPAGITRFFNIGLSPISHRSFELQRDPPKRGWRFKKVETPVGVTCSNYE